MNLTLCAATLLALSLSAAPVLAKKPAVQTLPKGQLYEQREVKLGKAQCRAQVIARGSLEGVYEGEECGEGCSAVFRLDSGEKAYLGTACDADKFYGPVGRRVVAHFEVRRAWYEYAEQGARGCEESMVCVAPPAGAQAQPSPPPAVQSAELSFDEASRIVQDTFTIWLYVGVKDEADYAKPENVIRAALFGAYDARTGFDYKQAMKKDEGEKPAPLSAPLFSVGGRSVAARQVVLQEDKPALFKGLPTVKMEWGEMPYNVHIDRQTVELAALRFTGRAVTKHIAPKDVHLNEAGYFMLIDGLGDTGREPQLARVEPRGTGYVLSGTLKNEMGDGQPDESFRLSIAPGDAPGAWRREALTLEPLKPKAKN